MTSQGIQLWTVPRSGSYQITAIGAAGGAGTAGTGRGARMIGTFSLTSGQILKIAVGQQGLSSATACGGFVHGGGGGGSFVTDNSNNALIIAGGGGGVSSQLILQSKVDATTATSGNAGEIGGSGSTPGSGGTGGGGGGAGTGCSNVLSYGGSGGGGLTGNGTSIGVTANGGTNSSSGGLSFTNGGLGGNATGTYPIAGGFGGGGSGGDYPGGGGGGYSGGGGGALDPCTCSNLNSGGGGGSINNGTSQSNTTGIGTVMGSVTITSLTSQPDPPTAAFATAGFASAVVTFSPPANNGGATITSYTVTSSPGGFTASGAGSPLTVTGLTNGTTYTFTVTATNSVGTSSASAASNPVTPFTTPGAPRSVTAVPGNGEATVSFLPPTTNGGNNIFEYLVVSTPEGKTATGFESPITIGGLTNGTSYTFIVEARNLGGYGADSTASAAIIVGVPSQPLNPLAIGGNQQAVVTFDPPATDNGSAISSFRVTASPGGATAVDTTSTITVGSLSTNTAYTFTVAATNEIGTSAESQPTPSILLGTPDAPTGVTATAGAAQASVAFTPGADEGSTITEFRVTAIPGIGGTPVTATGSASPINVTGLTNGVVYTFTVRATNSVANSPESAPSAPVTPLDVPGAPTITRATSTGSGTALIYFTAPASNGGSDITNYTVTSDPAGAPGTGTGLTSPITVTGLTDTTIYTFTMIATNAQGDSAPSAASNQIVAGTTVPDPPTNVVATGGGERSLTVSWDAPANTGGLPVTGYRIIAQPGIPPILTVGSPVTFGGLVNADYSFVVIAVNDVGDSAPSAASSAVRPQVTGNLSRDPGPDFLMNQTASIGAGITGVRRNEKSSGGSAKGVQTARSPYTAVTTVTGSAAAVTTTAASSILGFTATVGGNVTSDGGQTITQRGVCWSTNPNPTKEYTNVSLASGTTGAFSIGLVGLSYNTLYYVRAFAVNSRGTTYGTQVSFTSLFLPIVSTLTTTSVTQTTALAAGNVVNTGGTTVTTRGLIWNSTPYLETVLTSKTADIGSYGTGAFTTAISSLLFGTTFFIRPYATTAVGTNFGETTFINTLNPSTAWISTNRLTGWTASTVTAGGNLLSTGGVGIVVSEAGLVWSLNPLPTIDLPTKNVLVTNSLASGNSPYTMSAIRFTAYAVGQLNANTGFFDIGRIAPSLNGTRIPITGESYTFSESSYGGFSSLANMVAAGTSGFTRITLSSTSYNSRTDNATYFGYVMSIPASFTITFSGTITANEIYIQTNTTNIATWFKIEGFINSQWVSLHEDGAFPSSKYSSGRNVSFGQDQSRFSTTIGGLGRESTFFLRTYAQNPAGVAYGQQVSFTTLNTARLSTLAMTFPTAASSIQTRQAFTFGNIVFTGGSNVSSVEAVTTAGTVWSTSPNPTVALPTKTVLSTVNYSTIVFSSIISTLTFSTLYYIRAFAQNSVDVAYGEERTFRTAFPSTAIVSTIFPFAQLSTGTGIQSGGRITDDGGWLVGRQGVIWSLSPNPTIGSISTFTINGVNVGTGSYTSVISSLAISSLYYIRAYTSSLAGESYGTQLSFYTYNVPQMSSLNLSAITTRSAWPQGRIANIGGMFPSTYGFAWNTQPTPLWNVHSSLVGAGTLSSFTRELSSLIFSTTYYVRSYGINTVGIGYSPEFVFTTRFPSTATVSTVLPFAQLSTGTGITSGGNVTDDGGWFVGSRGVLWSLLPNPTLSSISTLLTVNGVNTERSAYSSIISSLAISSLYYIRAYTSSVAGVTFGNQLIFSTFNVPIMSTILPYSTTTRSAFSGGILTNRGGGDLSTIGFTWGTSPDPLAYQQSTIVPSNVETPLYSFTTNTFTNASATGRNGPILTQIQSAYSVQPWASNTAFLNMITQGVQLWTVPTTGVYSFTLAGAIAGGTTGLGRIISGSYTLSKGTILAIIVGQRGTSGNGVYNVGGGGGTFVFIQSTNQLLFAAGGGGGGNPYVSSAGLDGNFGTAGGNGTGTSAGTGGTNGGPGSGASSGNNGSGGNGGTDDGVGGGGGGTGNASAVYIGGFNSSSSTNGGVGGFGGAGGSAAGGSAAAGGGGGGGYSGGGGGGSFTFPSTGVGSGGGGGSFGITTITNNGTNSGNGYVTINLVSASNVPVISISSLVSEMSSLTFSTLYYVRSFGMTSVGFNYGDQYVFRTRFPSTATVSTIAPFAQLSTGTGIQSGGNVTNDGGWFVGSRGVVWSLLPNPTLSSISTFLTVNGVNTERSAYGSVISSLAISSLYYIRAYTSSLAGETYGTQLSFYTYNVPQMSTPNMSAITTRSVWPQGLIANIGGMFPSTYGFAWNTSPTPLWNVHSSLTGTGTLSSFTREMSSLLFSTTYYVRSYGMNTVGIGYSPEIEVTTRFPSTATVSTVQPFAQLSTGTGITSGGNVTDDGGWFVGSRGVVWSLLPNPTLSSISTFLTVNGVNTERSAYTSVISSLEISSLYYIRAYTSTVAGETYGNELGFYTFNVPQMSTPNISAITTRSAWPQSRFDNTGGVFPSTFGFAWNTEPTPLWNVHSSLVGTGNISSFTREMSSLLFSTTYYVRSYGINNVGIGYSPEMVITTLSPSTPTVSTQSLFLSTNGTHLTTGGLIPFDGGSDVTSRGLVWDSNPAPELNLVSTQTFLGIGVGLFSGVISSLMPSTTYYVRAFGSNVAGVNYGEERSFLSFSPPTMSTFDVSSVLTRSAWSGGTMLNTGGGTVSTFGITWNTEPGPVVYQNSTLTGFPGGSLSSFTAQMSSLVFSTTYYIRSFGITTVGTGYGDEVSFTTPFPSTPTVQTVSTAVSTIGTVATAFGNVINDGGWTVDSRGFVWDTNSTPTVELSTQTLAPAGMWNFSSIVSSLSLSTLYYIRAFASNVAGVEYGEEQTFLTHTVPTLSTNAVSAITTRSAWSGGTILETGGGVVSTFGVTFNTEPEPQVFQNSTLTGVGTLSSFVREMSSLLFSTTYYARSYAITTVGLAYGEEVSFTTLEASTPTVSTIALVGAANALTATTGGVIEDDGGATIMQRGVVWDVNPEPTVELSTQQINPFGGTATYTATISTLSTNTLYYARAYASNAVGLVYGQDVSTLTNDFPMLSTTEISTNIGSTTATAFGYIVSTGRTAVTSYGFAFSFLSTPTVLNSTIAGNGATTAYMATMSTLQPGSNYYIRSYGSNAVGITYGEETSFSTLTAIPWISTLSAASSLNASSLVTASLVNTGGLPVTRRGIIWSPASSLVTSTTREETGLFSTGLFSLYATGIASTSTYYMRAFAFNSRGFGYGNLISLSATTGGGLYTFTSLRFTNAGVNGANGPILSQIRSAYSAQSWTQNASFLNMTTRGIQQWTVPITGSYQIEMAGAAGGWICDGSGTQRAGYGYGISGSMNLTQGTVVNIVVGQRGVGWTYPNGNTLKATLDQAAGGGGASALFIGSTLHMIAAGGNGQSWDQHTVPDPDGRGIATTVTLTGQGRGWQGATFGANGDGSTAAATAIGTSAIGGNANGSYAGAGSYITGNHGQLFAGGFGGGGGTNPYEGGGGGGYVAGIPKPTNMYGTTYPLQGATSFVSGNVLSSTNIGTNTSGNLYDITALHGYVTITKL